MPALVAVEFALGRLPRRRPVLAAGIVPQVDVAAAGVGGHVVVAVPGEPAQPGVTVIRVATRRVRDDAEVRVGAEVIDPGQRRVRAGDDVLAAVVVEVSVANWHFPNVQRRAAGRNGRWPGRPGDRGPGPRRSAFRAVQPGNDGRIRGARGGTGAARRACNLQAMSILGTRVLRTEDPGFLTRGAVYTDDVALPGACQVFFVRSPLAHARIRAIDVTGALAAPGVLAAFTGADLADLPLLPAPIPGLINDQMGQPPLARDVVRFVGEAVAVVVAATRAQAEDAAELVDVDYDPLPPVLDPAQAADDADVLFPEAGTNIAATFGDAATLDPGLFDGCEVVVRADIVNQRIAPAPMETRAAAAVWARPADRVDTEPGRAEHPERAGRAARHRPGRGADHHPGCGRRVRRQVRRGPGARGGLLGGPPAGPPSPLGGEPEREPGRDDARPGAAADGDDRRPPRRHRHRVPAGGPAGRRGLPAVRRVPADDDPDDDTGPVRDRPRRGGDPLGGHEHHAGRRLPGCRAAGGHRRHRAGHGPVRGRDRTRPG